MNSSHDISTDTNSELGDIVALAAGAGSFSTLLAAETAAGLVETLQGVGPFTVFAPNDEAFAKLPEGLVAALLKKENHDTLVKVLTYHVISGRVRAAEVFSGDCPTVEGSTIEIVVGDKVVLNKTTHVIATDIMASNGVIHVIDSVLLPEGLDAAALMA